MFRRFAGVSLSLPTVSNVRCNSTVPLESGTAYDLVVIGGGSGGLAVAKRSAEHGAKVAIIEASRWGGTCVNVGCVPKKIMWNTAHVAEILHDAKHFGIVHKGFHYDWVSAKAARDTYIKRLNQIYEGGLSKLNIDRIAGFGSFAPTTSSDGLTHLHVDGADGKFTSIAAKHVVVAVGGTPSSLGGIPGEDLALDSNGFFELEQQPKKAAVIGAGYIAVELAGVLNALGSDTSLFVRGDTALRPFDSMLKSSLDASMKKAGIKVVNLSTPRSLAKAADGTISVAFENGQTHHGFDVVIAATGRRPMSDTLNLHLAGVARNPKTGYLIVDEYQNTSREGVYALGDCAGKVELTPMAIAAGRVLGDRLFGGSEHANKKADYADVPTVVFSHPPIGTVGLTEEEAVTMHGSDKIKVYNSSFVNLFYGSFYNGGVGDKPISRIKLVTVLPEERVVGLHVIGLGADEMLQGFAVALKMGATKADLDKCVAIHPTAAEEVVTLPPWGKSQGGGR
jgi:glutathione reductase (NADPH)